MFGVESKDKEVRSYLLGLKKSSEEMIFNPFDIIVKEQSKGFFVLDFKPIFPKVFKVGLLMLPFFLLLRGLSFWLVIPLVLAGTSIFWFDRYYYFMIWLGLKKKKITTKDLKYVNCQDVARRLI